jgi:hypothetical protein
MARLTLLAVVFLLVAVGHGRSSAAPQLYVWEGEHLEATKTAFKEPSANLERLAKSLRRQADKALQNKSYSVTYNEYVAPSGDEHDYVSFGAYWWPDPSKKDGLPFIRRDGETNQEQKKLGDKEAFNEFARDVQTLALAYYLLEDERYAEHTLHLINDWFINPETLMNPHLEYAQAVLGRNHGKSTGIIDTRDFIYVLESLELLKESPAWTPELESGLKEWFTQFLEWLGTSDHGKHENRAKNNHGAWYQAQVIRIALYLGKEQLARERLEYVRDELIPAQIMPDGTQPQELERTNAFHYSLFNLLALGTTARMGESLGEDLWHNQVSEGRSIQSAAEWVLPFVTGEKPWNHQQISTYRLNPVTNTLFRVLSNRYNQPAWLDPKSEIRMSDTAYDPSLMLVAAEESPEKGEPSHDH